MYSLCVLVVACCLVGVLNASDPLTHLYTSFNETDSGLHHWLEYGEFYNHHLHKTRTLPSVKMLEIGVQSGGSSRVWNKYFAHADLDYTGVDVNENCVEYALPPRIRIEIGSQLDQDFLRKMCKQYGPFNFIVDDGGHTTKMMVASFEVLWSPECLVDNALYVIEDTHTMAQWIKSDTMYVGNHQNIFHYLADILLEQVYYFGFRGAKIPMPERAKHMKSMSFADSIVAMHYRAQWRPLTDFHAGKFIPYNVNPYPQGVF